MGQGAGCLFRGGKHAQSHQWESRVGSTIGIRFHVFDVILSILMKIARIRCPGCIVSGRSLLLLNATPMFRILVTRGDALCLGLRSLGAERGDICGRGPFVGSSTSDRLPNSPQRRRVLGGDRRARAHPLPDPRKHAFGGTIHAVPRRKSGRGNALRTRSPDFPRNCLLLDQPGAAPAMGGAYRHSRGWHTRFAGDTTSQPNRRSEWMGRGPCGGDAGPLEGGWSSCAQLLMMLSLLLLG